MKRTKCFFANALILACSSVIMRAAGVSFNVYITNKIGAEGIGLFGLIMSVYTLATTVANSGVSLAATRLVTEELATACHGDIKNVMTRCLLYSLSFGLSAAFLLGFFAPQIGQYWLCDRRTVRSLQLLAFSLPCISLSSAMTGYFMAVRRVIKSASAQLFEQVIKITITVIALHSFVGRGIEYACMAVVGGGSVAEICSCIYIYCFYLHDRKRYKTARTCSRRITARLLQTALPVAVSSYLRSGLLTLEHLLVPVGLKKYGATASASLSQYGVIHGMVMPVLLFPSSLISAFAGLLIPELTWLQTRQKSAGINRIAHLAFTTTLHFSIGAAAIFFAFAEELGQTIYKSGDAVLFIRFLAPLTLVMYMDGVTDAMLKGLNQQVASMRYNIIDSAISVLLIYTLLPRFGVNGYLAVIFTTELLNAFLSINRLISVTDLHFSVLHDIGKPIAIATVAILAVRFVVPLLHIQITAPYSLALAILSVLCIYYFLLYISKHISERNLPAFF